MQNMICGTIAVEQGSLIIKHMPNYTEKRIRQSHSLLSCVHEDERAVWGVYISVHAWTWHIDGVSMQRELACGS